MNRFTLQVQSVIFKNKKDSLLKAINGVSNSIRFCRENDMDVEAVLVYGDASPEAVLSDEDVAEIRSKLEGSMRFEYKVFGFNSGTAKGHNLMCEECQSDFVMIMNPDIILASNCLYELLEPFSNEKVGMVEARQTPLEHAKAYDRETGETEWASTACTVFRKKVFDDINGFDAETFFMYCDDLDFSWRVRADGYKVIYKPNAVVYHAKKLSLNAGWIPTPAEIYYSAEAALLLAYKWSNFSRVDKILAQFETVGGESEKKAAKSFRDRKETNKLPVPIDKEHKIAKFIGDEYCEMRFKMN